MLKTFVNVVPGRTEPGALPVVEITLKRMRNSPMARRMDFIGNAGFLRPMLQLEDTRMELSGVALAGFELGARWVTEQLRKKAKKKVKKAGKTSIHIRAVGKKRFKKEKKRRKKS